MAQFSTSRDIIVASIALYSFGPCFQSLEINSSGKFECTPSCIPAAEQSVYIPLDHQESVTSYYLSICERLEAGQSLQDVSDRVVRLCYMAEGGLDEGHGGVSDKVDGQCFHLALLHLLLQALLVPVINDPPLSHNAFVAGMSYCNWVAHAGVASLGKGMDIIDLDVKNRFGCNVALIQQYVILVMHAIMKSIRPDSISVEDFRWLLPCLIQTHSWEVHKLGSLLADGVSSDCLSCLRHGVYQVALALACTLNQKSTTGKASATVLEGERLAHVYLATTIQGFFLVQSTSTHNEAGQGSVPNLGASEKTVVSGNAQPVKLHVQLYILLMFLAMCPPQVSRCHMLEIVGVVASSIGIYYVPLQLMTIELCTLLAARDSGLSHYFVRLAAEYVRIYLYYARGCSDVGALLDWQRTDSTHSLAIADDRAALMRRIKVVCTETFPCTLKSQSCGWDEAERGTYGQYVAFFEKVKKDSALHTTVLREWDFCSI